MNGGGAERQLSYLAGEFTKIGWDVHVALLYGGRNWARLKKSGAVIHMLTGRNNYDPRIFWQLKRLMRLAKPDLIQTWLLQMDIFGGAAARAARIPWIFSERSSAMAYPPTLKNRLRVFWASAASGVVSNSVAGDHYWQSRLNGSVLRRIIPNGLPLDEIEAAVPAALDEIGLKTEKDMVLFVGRFSPEKNLETLLLALREVVARPRTVAVLCGEGPLRLQLEQWLAKYAIADQVRLAGYVPDIWSWMKRASVLVSVGFFEGHPNAVLEAMACGIPLVVSDIPAHREFLDEHSALLVNPHVPEAIAHAIISVLSSPEAAARRVILARAKAAQWSIPVIADRYAQVYREVLARCAQMTPTVG